MDLITASPTSPPTSGHTEVKRQLERDKAAGPDGVSLRVQKIYVGQLSGILQHLFNLNDLLDLIIKRGMSHRLTKTENNTAHPLHSTVLKV